MWGGRGTLHKNTVIPGPGLGVLSPSDLTALQPGAALDTEFHYVQEPARSRVVGSGRQGQQGPPAGTGRGPEAGREAGAADGGRSSRDRPSAICQPRCAVDSPAATVPPSVTPRTISTSLASGSGRAFVPQGQTRPNDSVDHGSSPRSRETRRLPPTRSATGTRSAHLGRVQQGEPPWSPAGPHGTLKPTGPWMEHAVRVSSRRAGARRGSSVPSEEGARAARTHTQRSEWPSPSGSQPVALMCHRAGTDVRTTLGFFVHGTVFGHSPSSVLRAWQLPRQHKYPPPTFPWDMQTHFSHGKRVWPL